MRRAAVVCVVACLAPGLPSLATRARSDPASDRLAAEIDRWAAFLRTNAATGEDWTQVKQVTEPVMARTQSALREGRRLLALQRLVAMQVNLAAAAYVQARPASARDEAGFEAEWTRMGGVLGDGLVPPRADALAAVRPALVRALGEAALPQTRVYYDASLDYGRSTMPQAGLFYLGAAQAAADVVELCRALSTGVETSPPPVRLLRGEIEALEGDLLAAYRPPASIDAHSDFIAASAALKEARELDAAGLRYGALLRYLQAALRFAPVRPAVPRESARLAGQLRDLEGRLAGGGIDHSLGRLFLESAQEALAAADPKQRTAAAAIAGDVLPRYFAALEPARPEPPRPAPRVTVTLVRWPYT
jgi:hypothetical protein